MLSSTHQCSSSAANGHCVFGMLSHGSRAVEALTPCKPVAWRWRISHRRAADVVRYLLDRVADNNRRYLVDSHIQAAPEVEALLEEPT